MYRNFELSQHPKIVGYEWTVEPAESIVCLVHGIGEHAGRYDRIGEMLKASNIAMVGMDLRGHGLSSGKQGHTAPRKRILEDIDQLIEYAAKKYPGLPLFLYGHSMGGNIALDYRLRGKYKNTPASYLITSPWIQLYQKIPAPLQLFAQIMAGIKPDFQMSSRIRPELLGNPEIMAKQDNLHLIHGKITVRTALDGLSTAEKLLNHSLELAEGEVPKPFLLMHGEMDRICDPEGSRRLAELEKERCRYIEWSGLLHEIHNGSLTSDGSEVIETIINWILNYKTEKAQPDQR